MSQRKIYINTCGPEFSAIQDMKKKKPTDFSLYHELLSIKRINIHKTYTNFFLVTMDIFLSKQY